MRGLSQALDERNAAAVACAFRRVELALPVSASVLEVLPAELVERFESFYGIEASDSDG